MTLQDNLDSSLRTITVQNLQIEQLRAELDFHSQRSAELEKAVSLHQSTAAEVKRRTEQKMLAIGNDVARLKSLINKY